MPSAYFRGDTHYQITVKRDGKTDFYVIPSRDRNLNDERHVIGVYARILENFPINEGYGISLDKFDGEPRKEKIDVAAFAGAACGNQITKIEHLLTNAQKIWDSLEPEIKKNRNLIQEAFNIIKKISETFSNKQNNWQEEAKKRDALIQELNNNAPYNKVNKIYEEYVDLTRSSLREVALLRFYDKTDADKVLNKMTEFGSLQKLLVHCGINIGNEHYPFGHFYSYWLKDQADSLMYFKSKIMTS